MSSSDRDDKGYFETITIGEKIISQAGDIIGSLLKSSSSVVIITDEVVSKLHLNKLLNSISYLNSQVITIQSGEASKSREVKAYIETQMLKLNCDRDTLIIALGGGVVSDLSGFVAATYMRGISYVNIPTTLLAMVDGSVGGKVAINTPEGKNLIGAYWQPSKIIMDTDVLATLPQLQLINGAIESLKMFLTCDKESFLKYEQSLEELLLAKKEVLEWLVQQSVSMKSDVVKRDEREGELRKILNFGHTIGHAIEKASNYKILHGIAVGYGLLVESKISYLLNLLSNDEYRKIKSILLKLNFKISELERWSQDDLFYHMKYDKKNRNNKIYGVLLNGIGSVKNVRGKVSHVIDVQTIKRAIQAVIEEGLLHAKEYKGVQRSGRIGQ